MNLDEVIHIAVDKISYGTVTLTFKKNDDTVTTVDTTTITSNRVQGNAQALTMIGSILRAMSSSKSSGQLTFTIQVNNGEAASVLTQDFKRSNYKDKQYQ